MKNNILTVQSPLHMPKSVKTAISKIWKKIPDNVSNICYSYGEICFSPRELTRDLVVHESTHTEQQRLFGSVDSWWEEYGNNSEFRYQQEVEAYRNQYLYIVATKGKRIGYMSAEMFASEMASEMYGGMCTKTRALQDILHK